MAADPTLVFAGKVAGLERTWLRRVFPAEEVDVCACLLLTGLFRWAMKPDDRGMGAGMIYGIGKTHDLRLDAGGGNRSLSVGSLFFRGFQHEQGKAWSVNGSASWPHLLRLLYSQPQRLSASTCMLASSVFPSCTRAVLLLREARATCYSRVKQFRQLEATNTTAVVLMSLPSSARS